MPKPNYSGLRRFKFPAVRYELRDSGTPEVAVVWLRPMDDLLWDKAATLAEELIAKYIVNGQYPPIDDEPVELSTRSLRHFAQIEVMQKPPEGEDVLTAEETLIPMAVLASEAWAELQAAVVDVHERAGKARAESRKNPEPSDPASS